MPSPTFDSNKLFSSLDSRGNPIDEGVLWVPSYSQIAQKLHFEGEVGDYTLFHGYPDMQWRYDGYLSAYSGSDFGTLISNIQDAIDEATDDASTYKALVDSFGTSYANAQVRTFAFSEPPHVTADGGWVAKVSITGVIQGNEHIGDNSANSNGGGQ